MSTATMRLRRAGAGGLAAAVIAGTLVATAGAALAAPGVAGVNGPTTIYAGSTAQAGDNIKITLPAAWSIGDTVTFTWTGDCTSAATTIGLSGTPTGTAALGTGAASTAVLPTFSIAASDGAVAGCAAVSVNHTFTVTLKNDATGQSVAPTITLKNVAYNLGSGTLGPLNLTWTSAGTIGAGTGSVPSAVIANTKLAAASVTPVAASTTTKLTGIALGNVTASDVGSARIKTDVSFTLDPAGAFFTAGSTPTLTGAGTWTLKSGLGTNTITFTSSSTLPTTANSYVLSGAKIDLPAANFTGLVGMTATSGAGAIGAEVPVASVVFQSRVGGSDRYSTAAALFNQNFKNNPVAVLASGANFPDALSATFLAAQEKTGTLLTNPLVLPSVTLNALITNGVGTVYIVGGPGAVSSAVENQIAATHVSNIPTNAFINVVRVWGADRYATNKAVNEYNFSNHSTAVIATGENFADALSVGPAVYDQQFPLVLTTTAALSASASQQLTDMGVKNVVIVGGTGAVSSAVETSLKGMGITITARLAGTDRTQTAAAIATWETNSTTATPVAGLGFDQTTAHMANGANFPDALAAGPVAGNAANVILLSLSPTSIGAGAPAYLGGLNLNTIGAAPTAATVDTLNALGLTGAVSPAVMNAAAVALAG